MTETRLLLVKLWCVCVCVCLEEGEQPVKRDLTVLYLIDMHMTRDPRHRRVPISVRACRSRYLRVYRYDVCHHTRLVVLRAAVGLYRCLHGDGNAH